MTDRDIETDVRRRRRAARRTALVLGCLAVAIFVAYFLWLADHG